MKLTSEVFEKAKSCKSEEELASLAKKEGFEMSEEEIKETFETLNKKGELSDDELDKVSGGCDESGETPLYQVGDKVKFYAAGVLQHSVIEEVSEERLGSFGKEWCYKVSYEVYGSKATKWLYESKLTKE